MTSASNRSNIFATGLAMFSMFFGAGNVIFPLALGQEAQNMNLYAILGLLITAVGVPFLGLLAMTLYDGCYQSYFGRVGKWPGFIIALVIMGLIGPFGAIPRCITLSHSTIKLFIPGISLPVFSLISCLIVLALTWQRKNLIDILGYVLTPLLLGSLALIIVLGLWKSPEMGISDLTSLQAFSKGVIEGYQTMDLLGALFFSSVIILCLKQSIPKSEKTEVNQIATLTMKASIVGAGLLALVYVCFSFVAAFHSKTLGGIPKDELISQIALQVMGPNAGIVPCLAVALACLTTAIALATVFAEFIHEDITMEKLGYLPCLFITLILTYFVSTLEFSGIAKVLVPALNICYPALIVMSILNILYKLYGFEPIKLPVFLTFAGSIVAYLI